MQQSWNMAPPAGGALGQSRIAHPVRRYALIFGLLNGLFAALQVAVGSVAALENRAALGSLYYGIQNEVLDPAVVYAWLAPILAATYGSCLVAFGFGMWLCWHAGRAAALAAGRDTGGASAGMLASVIGSGIWIAASIAGALILHTDGTISGIFATTPSLSDANIGGELLGLLTQEGVAAFLALGFGAVAGRMGAASVRFPPRAAPPMPYGPYYTAAAPPPPAGYPAGGPPLPSYPTYPPPPEWYRGSGQTPGQPFYTAYPPPLSSWPLAGSAAPPQAAGRDSAAGPTPGLEDSTERTENG
jgi:hypothetical protein